MARCRNCNIISSHILQTRMQSQGHTVTSRCSEKCCLPVYKGKRSRICFLDSSEIKRFKPSSMLSLFLSMPLNEVTNLLKENKGIIGHHNLCISTHMVEVSLKDSLSSKSSRSFAGHLTTPCYSEIQQIFPHILYSFFFMCCTCYLLIDCKLSFYDSIVYRSVVRHYIVSYPIVSTWALQSDCKGLSLVFVTSIYVI